MTLLLVGLNPIKVHRLVATLMAQISLAGGWTPSKPPSELISVFLTEPLLSSLSALLPLPDKIVNCSGFWGLSKTEEAGPAPYLHRIPPQLQHPKANVSNIFENCFPSVKSQSKGVGLLVWQGTHRWSFLLPLRERDGQRCSLVWNSHRGQGDPSHLALQENILQRGTRDQFLKDELEIVGIEYGVYIGGDMHPLCALPTCWCASDPAGQAIRGWTLGHWLKLLRRKHFSWRHGKAVSSRVRGWVRRAHQ